MAIIRKMYEPKKDPGYLLILEHLEAAAKKHAERVIAKYDKKIDKLNKVSRKI